MDLFDQYFIFSKSALRVTALPFYDCGETEEVKAYMAGETFPKNHNQEWCSKVSNWTQEGKRLERIRVIPEKNCDYTKFESMCFQYNTWAGEVFQFIKERQYLEIAEKYQIFDDFWILDEEKVLLLKYDDQNDYIGCQLLEEAETYLQFYRELEKYCYPYSYYLKQIREQMNISL